MSDFYDGSFYTDKADIFTLNAPQCPTVGRFLFIVSCFNSASNMIELLG